MKKPSPWPSIFVVLTTIFWVDFYVEIFFGQYIFPPPAWEHVELFVYPPRTFGYPFTAVMLFLYFYLWRSYFKRLAAYRKFDAEKTVLDGASAAASRAADSWPPPPT
jgi:hypothetical protein